MLVLKQLLIVGSGCVTGVVAAGFFLAATAPAATRSLDYLLAAMVFLLGFATGTAVAGRLTLRVSIFQPVPKPAGEPATNSDLGPLAEEAAVVPLAAKDFSRSR